LLKLNDVHAYYGLSHVLQGISLEIGDKEIVTLLGRNGMGKTTTFNTIMGVIQQTSGNITLQGEDIRGLPPHKVARKGIGYIPQGKMPFPTLTVLENLSLGTSSVAKASKEFISEKLDEVYELFPILKERRLQRAMTLSGGEQQMLAIARALMGEPKLLLLDEPSESLAPIVVRQIFDTVRKLREKGNTVFLAEQNVKGALEISDRCYVLEKGKIVFEGSSREVEKSEIAKTSLGV